MTRICDGSILGKISEFMSLESTKLPRRSTSCSGTTSSIQPTVCMTTPSVNERTDLAQLVQ